MRTDFHQRFSPATFRALAAPASFDIWLLAWACVAWYLAAWLQVPPPSAALLGFGSALLLCKALAMPPLLRALAVPIPLIPLLPILGSSAQPAEIGTLAACTGYAAFTVLRRTFYTIRALRFRTPDGRDLGWDHGQLLLMREHMSAHLRPRPPRRVLFPPTSMEPWLRESFKHSHDLLTFAPLSAENIRGHDLVVPLTLADIDRARGLGELLRDNPLPLPDPACVALCDDKLLCNRALSSAGFGACIPAISDMLPYPYVLKKRRDAWGTNTHIIANHDDEHRHETLLQDPDYFRQAFIPGRHEYATHLLVRDRRIAAAITVEYAYAYDLHKRCREQPPGYNRIRRNMHLPLFQDMLVAIGFEGLCCVNYKLEAGRVRLMEINPRFGTSLAHWFSIMARAL